jgi:hypothetical protein
MQLVLLLACLVLVGSVVGTLARGHGAQAAARTVGARGVEEAAAAPSLRHPARVQLELRLDGKEPIRAPIRALVRGDGPRARVVLAAPDTKELYYVDLRFGAASPFVVKARLVRLPNGHQDLLRVLDPDVSAPDQRRLDRFDEVEAVATWTTLDAQPFPICSAHWPDGRSVQLVLTRVDDRAPDRAPIARRG